MIKFEAENISTYVTNSTNISKNNKVYFDSPFEQEITSPCLIKAFFDEEKKKHPLLRSTFCMIACPCPKCSVRC